MMLKRNLCLNSLKNLRYSGLVLLALLVGCEEEPVQLPPAAITLKLDGFRHEYVENRHRYYHRRLFENLSETAGTITKGRVCVERGKVCVEALVEYRIEGKGNKVQEGSYFATKMESDQVSLEYWIEDDAGNEHRLKQSVKVLNGAVTLIPTD